jgi:hypothetical protein
VQVGGVPYLVPLAQTDRRPYSLTKIADSLGYSDAAFFVGAAAGPCHKVGVNSELIPNFYKDEQMSVNETHCAKLAPGSEKGYELHKLTDIASACDEFCLLGNLFLSLGNLFLSQGNPGIVVKVTAKKRTTDTNFVTVMRNILVSPTFASALRAKNNSPHFIHNSANHLVRIRFQWVVSF